MAPGIWRAYLGNKLTLTIRKPEDATFSRAVPADKLDRE